jgi:hypothetical protein
LVVARGAKPKELPSRSDVVNTVNLMLYGGGCCCAEYQTTNFQDAGVVS